MTVLLVALGAAVGAPLRYVAGHLLDVRFPWGTVLVNVAGSFLLGNQRKAWQAFLGLLVIVFGITVVVYEIHGHTTAQLIFIPTDFVIAWAAGFVLFRETLPAGAQGGLQIASFAAIVAGAAFLGRPDTPPDDGAELGSP